jgi:hypothetical protein
MGKPIMGILPGCSISCPWRRRTEWINLDAVLRKDKLIKSNLRNYGFGTNATGIMCRDYKPCTILNGVEKN